MRKRGESTADLGARLFQNKPPSPGRNQLRAVHPGLVRAARFLAAGWLGAVSHKGHLVAQGFQVSFKTCNREEPAVKKIRGRAKDGSPSSHKGGAPLRQDNGECSQTNRIL